MATKLANGWTDYALLTPTKGGKPWKVQINSEGRFRCSCPAFIFQKAPSGERSCKHTRRCEVEYAKEKGADFVKTIATLPAPAAVAAVKPVVNRWHEEATKATDAMLTAGRLFASEAQTAQMVAVLAARLKAFNGEAAVRIAPAVVSQAVAIGVRHITFDD